MIKSNSIENRCINVLLLFYFFSLLGICIPATRELFIALTPLNLFITLAIFYKINKDYSPRFLMLSLLVFLIGFSVEGIGVATGVLFRSYSYGSVFEFKLFETPIMIGVNWLFLALSTYNIIQFFTNKGVWLILLPPVLNDIFRFINRTCCDKTRFLVLEK